MPSSWRIMASWQHCTLVSLSQRAAHADQPQTLDTDTGSGRKQLEAYNGGAQWRMSRKVVTGPPPVMAQSIAVKSAKSEKDAESWPGAHANCNEIQFHCRLREQASENCFCVGPNSQCGQHNSALNDVQNVDSSSLLSLLISFSFFLSISPHLHPLFTWRRREQHQLSQLLLMLANVCVPHWQQCKL